MDKINKKQIEEKLLNIDHIHQKPVGTTDDLTEELKQTGMPLFTERDVRIGSLKFDTPHLHKHQKADNFMVAVLPLMVQNEVKDLISRKFPEYADNHGVTFFHGHLYPENIFYRKIEDMQQTRSLPDILITSDLNTLYHRSDILRSGYFEIFQYAAHSAFAGSGLVKPGNAMRFLAADCMVIVADRNKYMQSQMPREWYELLHPQLNESIVFCGETDFFCHTTYAHFVRDYGLNVLTKLKQNIAATIHPIEMIKTLTEGNRTGARLFVMPYSYARLLEQNINYQIIWPEDGAIILPVQMLVKKSALEKHKKLIDLFTSAEMGRVFALSGLIPVNVNTGVEFQYGKLNWLGWNFLQTQNISELKRNINNNLNTELI